MLNKHAEYLIKKLCLQTHPEGGYFVESYRAERLRLDIVNKLL
jgi:predicted cupin superfamily sugar epimerase